MSQPPNHAAPDEASWRPADADHAVPAAQTPPQGGYGSGSYDPNAPIAFDSSYWDPSYNPAQYGAQPATNPAPYGGPPVNQPAPFGAPPVNREAGYGAPPVHYPAPLGSPPPYGGMPYGGMPYAMPPPSRPKISGAAITSLVFGLIGGVFFSIGFGIRALIRIKRGDRRGKGLAVAGLALSAVWICIIGLLAAYAAGRAPTRTSAGTVTHAGQISPLQLHVGDCVEVPLSLNSSIRSITVEPCSQPHNAQVFAQVEATNASYPGLDALKQQGIDDCSQHVQAFLNRTRTLLSLVDVVPASEAWDLGDRTEECLLVDRRHDITGDIRKDG